MTYGSDGSPNGVETLRSSRSVSSAMSYSPDPPMIPIWTRSLTLVTPFSVLQGRERLHHRASVLLADISGRNRRIVLEENDVFPLDRFPHEGALELERLHRIQVVRHDP